MDSVFIISLDFELHWGGCEKWELDKYRQYFLNTRKIIPEMLSLFQAYDVHATWATVGMLFHADKMSLLGNAATLKPSYHISQLSPYHYIQQSGIGESESNDPFHFASSLVAQIAVTTGQELGSHTFAHYYCNEPGQTIEQFRADIQAAQRSAKLFDKTLTSLVFPRNQFNEQYLRVCFEEGITAVRDNPRDWFWQIRSTQHESKWKRLNRGLDAYLAVGKKNTYAIKSLVHRYGLPVCIPASRLLRPYRPSEIFLNDMKISRILGEMTRAARQGEVYHLWWHPHNFGNYPEQSMEGLKKILDHFALCRERHAMKSLNMGEVAAVVMRI